MVKDGFYKVQFSAAVQGAGGVVVVENGVVRGADDQYLYAGKIATNGSSLTAQISVSAYQPNAVSVFNTAGGKFTLSLSGTVSGDNFHLTGNAPIAGIPEISIHGSRVAALTL
ncbi:GrlR family regulatory protein [Cupriavidus metallidurans]|nr:GrlR family regulatory protein [Cupriavidus metallidurans]QGS32422.1 hypothetical protein FOB83_26680 [Cupriavidus metallidurans]